MSIPNHASIEAVVTALSGFPAGATVEEIEQAVTPRQTRRSVEYALLMLVEQTSIVMDSA